MTEIDLLYTQVSHDQFCTVEFYFSELAYQIRRIGVRHDLKKGGLMHWNDAL